MEEKDRKYLELLIDLYNKLKSYQIAQDKWTENEQELLNLVTRKLIRTIE